MSVQTKSKPAKTQRPDGRPVLVTTEYRGVFFGYGYGYGYGDGSGAGDGYGYGRDGQS